MLIFTLNTVWQEYNGNKYMCSLCSKHYGRGEMPITKKAINRHVESAHHQEAMLASNSPQPLSSTLPAVENYSTSLSLLQANIYPGLDSTIRAPQNISDLIQDIVFSQDCDDAGGFDPFALANTNADTSINLDDAPLYWNDSRFLKELGFSGTFLDNREEEDVTLTNVMQQLG